MPKRLLLRDIPFIRAPLEETFECIFGNKKFRIATVMHSYGFVLAQFDLAYQTAVRESDCVFSDGVGITALVSLMTGKSARITGSELFSVVMQHQNVTGGSIFFVGSDSDTLNVIEQRVRNEWPGIARIGTYAPPFCKKFSSAQKRLMIDAINRVMPNVVWVGMTAPKQEILISDIHSELKVDFIAGIGAVFDFYSRKKNRAPVWMRQLGLEWAYRGLQNPTQFFRRNLIGIPIFITIGSVELFERYLISSLRTFVSKLAPKSDR